MHVDKLLLCGALLVGAAMTFGGWASSFVPLADILHHFRLYTLAGSLVLLGLAMGARTRGVALGAALLVVINLWPVLGALDGAVARVHAAGPELKVVSINVWTYNEQHDAVVRLLRAEQADVAVLQEVRDVVRARLIRETADLYPHVHFCDCRNQLMLSKWPLIERGSQQHTVTHPGMLWARLQRSEGSAVTVYGLHSAYPLHPEPQARHYAWLTANVTRLTASGPTVIAGDFNMTPWAPKLQRLIAAGRLRRHGTWQRSWPADHAYLPPAFLIDHVLTTSDIGPVSFATGPNVGSDHLPVSATLSLPP